MRRGGDAEEESARTRDLGHVSCIAAWGEASNGFCWEAEVCARMEYPRRTQRVPAQHSGGDPAQTNNDPAPFSGAPRHRTILVAENEATNRHLMEQILRFAGYDTLAAANGREALDLLQTSHADLILVDISMPVLDGFATLDLLREQPPYATTPVVAVTAHATLEDRQRALRHGFTEYLTKPFRPRDLLRLVEQLLAPE